MIVGVRGGFNGLGVACNSHGSTLKKCFTLEMSSNQTSDEDLLNRHHQSKFLFEIFSDFL